LAPAAGVVNPGALPPRGYIGAFAPDWILPRSSATLFCGMSDAPVEPGQVLSGRFRVERVLGVGGMGVVVEATHLQLQQRIALKFLLPQMVQNEEAVQRFLREARAAATIRSEHVVRVSDVGTLDDGAPYMVMEFLDGIDLAQKLQAEGPLPPVQATELIMQALEAVAEAHAAHIIHRDLKPANLFLAHRRDGSPLVKVLDFGISKPLDENALDLTRTSSVMGSPYYMSPEQLRSSRGVDTRSDIWSIGVILYELISGDTPFQAESFGGLALAIGVEPHRPLIEVRPDVPQVLSDAVDRCLTKKAADRFQSVAELAVALRAVATSRSAMISVERISSVLGESAPPSMRAPASAAAAAALPLGQTNAGWGQTQGGPGAGRPPWLVGVSVASALGALAVGVALFASLRGGSEDPAATIPQESEAPAAAVAPPAVEPIPEPVVAPEPEPPPPPAAAAEPEADEVKAEEEAAVAPAPTAPSPVAQKPVVSAPRPVSRPAPAPAPTAKKSSFSALTRE
jgi:eukaryotic-like serine/threonine-protein kinase